MISCEKIKERLLTSYIDNELDEKSMKEVEAHLSGCSECRELEALLKKDIIAPLEGAALMEPSSEVWAAIEEEISVPVTVEAGVPFWERIRHTIFSPVPAAAVSFLVLGFMIFSIFHTSVSANVDIVVDNYFGKHIRFLDYLDSNSGDYYTDNDHLGFISPIEKYIF